MFQKIFSIVMAIVLLVSVIPVTVGMHYCGQSVMDVAFFDHAEKCGMDQLSNEISDHAEWSKMSCCSDKIVVLAGQNELTHNLVEMDLGQQVFLVALTQSYISLFDEWESLAIIPSNYLPPTLVRNIRLLDQVFII